MASFNTDSFTAIETEGFGFYSVPFTILSPCYPHTVFENKQYFTLPFVIYYFDVLNQVYCSLRKRNANFEVYLLWSSSI